MPLHPAIVHLPMALAVLIPVCALVVAWAVWTGRAVPRSWAVVVVLQALLFASGFVAMKTGEAEEDRVEGVVQRSALHQHEEYAEQFVWSAGGTFALAALVLAARRRSVTRALVSAAVAATFVVAALGVRVGHAGGQLVYVHGAASAYTPGQSAVTSEHSRSEHRR